MGAGVTSVTLVRRRTEGEWRKVDVAPTKGTLNGAPVTMPRAALIGGRQHFHARALIGACTFETDTIVELGAGWGLNLLDLYLAGGPPFARYRALELSNSGRACATRLAALEPALDFRADYFNYFEPDYRTIERSPHALVFSSHSVEQVPHMPRAAIEGTLALGERVTGVHFEPIGWQIREQRGMPPAQLGATIEHAEHANYNRDFWSVLVALERDGRIKINTAEPDLLGHKTKNALSYVVWEKV